jgi:NhaA family Na+:H+ antiporter
MAKKAPRRPPATRSVIGRLLSPVQALIKSESSSGVLLIAAALLAFAWANSPFQSSYFALLDTRIGIGVAGWQLQKPLLLWVNDLLMAIFFFLIGLEIKREVLIGELAGWRQAVLPIAGALGGMVVPALIFMAVNLGESGLRGWGVPMATDIAFALGVLALLGDRVSLPLKVFLLALAIVDDLGAVLVIALFYTEQLNVGALALAFLVFGAALLYGRFGGARPLGFALLGLVLWYCMLKSGVHSTIGGVLLAFAVPLRHRLSSEQLQQELRPLIGQGGTFEQVEVVIEHLAAVLERAHSPLHSIEHALAPSVAFGIMPIFAFCNAGVTLGSDPIGLVGTVSVGAALGLLIGKPIGVAGCAWLAVRAGLTRLPADMNWPGVVGIGLLAGIGFTMSLFIANLAYGPSHELYQAKLGVLAASVVAALAGLGFLSRALPRRARAPAPATRAPASAPLSAPQTRRSTGVTGPE